MGTGENATWRLATGAVAMTAPDPYTLAFNVEWL